MLRKAIYIPILLILSILISACSPPVQEVISPSSNNIESAALDNLDADRIYSNVEELSKEPRVAGTASEKNAANFITETIRDLWLFCRISRLPVRSLYFSTAC